MIDYAPFWETIKKKNISTYALREKYNISPNTLTRMKNRKYLSLRTVEDLCKVLQCGIGDIAVFLPDE